MESKSTRRLEVIASHLSAHEEDSNYSGIELCETAAVKGGKVLTSFEEDGIAIITLNSAPVNAIGRDLFPELVDAFESVRNDSRVKGIILTGKGCFSGGADIAEFVKVPVGEMRQMLAEVNRFLGNMENFPKPIVAAIDQFALGGGLELAMACHERVCTVNSNLGLPELKLGIIPGYGGTQRLPRLVGVQRAVTMTLKSTFVKGSDAQNVGLACKVVSNIHQLIPAAREIVKHLMTLEPQQFPKSFLKSDKLDAENDKMIYEMAKMEVEKYATKMPHLAGALNAIFEGVNQGSQKGLQRETAEFLELVTCPSAQGLIHVFFATKATKQYVAFGKTWKNKNGKPIKIAAVVGGGLMGSGIATALVLSGIVTYVKEINQQQLDLTVKRIRENVSRKFKKNEEKTKKMMNLVKPTLDYKDFDKVELVIEAVIEKLALKQQIFADLEKYCSPTAILASNTSTIDIEAIGKLTASKHRILGLHFFSPAHIMPLLEIVSTPTVSPQVLETAFQFGNSLQKTCIVVGNAPGFAINRIFMPYAQIVSFLIEGGIDPYLIDALVEDFGFPMGPLKVYDLSGIDIAVHVGNTFKDFYLERMHSTLLFEKMAAAGRLGQKVGKGFYNYEGRKPVKAIEAIQPIIEAAKKTSSVKKIETTNAEIVDMIIYCIINECCRVLGEKIVARPEDLDVGSIYGYGFPAFRGGIMFYASQEGYKKIEIKLQHWFTKYGVPIFRPCDHLKFLAEGNMKR